MMKNVFILIFIAACWTVLATSMNPPMPLEDRVMRADHIFVGTVKKMEVLDSQDNVVANPPSPLEHGTRLRLTAKPEAIWIRTYLKKLPLEVQITYDIGKSILSYDGEKDRCLNKTFIFLLVGEEFSPVSPLAFTVPREQLPVIMEIFDKKPVEKN